jgi:transcriptional regulator with XRE-family HTH domain
MSLTRKDAFIKTRIERGWSKTELAKHVSMSPSGISRIEKGYGVSEKAAKKLSVVLEKDIFELFKITQ